MVHIDILQLLREQVFSFDPLSHVLMMWKAGTRLQRLAIIDTVSLVLFGGYDRLGLVPKVSKESCCTITVIAADGSRVLCDIRLMGLDLFCHPF